MANFKWNILRSPCNTVLCQCVFKHIYRKKILSLGSILPQTIYQIENVRVESLSGAQQYAFVTGTLYNVALAACLPSVYKFVNKILCSKVFLWGMENVGINGRHIILL